MYELGKWRAKPEGYEFGTSGAGNPQVMVDFLFLEGPNEGRRIKWWGSLTDKAMEITCRALENCGWDLQDFEKMNGFGSRDVELDVQEEADQNGEMRPRVKWVNRPSTGLGAGKPLQAAGLTALNQRSAAIRLKRQQQREKDGNGDAPF